MAGFVVAEREPFAGYTVRDNNLVALGAYLQRQKLAAQLEGPTAFGGDRDLYKVLGFPKTLEFDNYLQLYERHDIAGRLVDLPAEDTWRKPPTVSEDGNMQTAFTEAWRYLVNKRQVFAKLSTADRLSGVGRFGILLMGVRDGKNLSEEITEGAVKGPKAILYLRPFHEGSVEIVEWEQDTQNERYNLPLIYSVEIQEDSTQNVHWTRVLHLAEEKGSNEAYGQPRLKRAYNQFLNKMKIGGGVAEAIWYAMRPGMVVSEREGYDPSGLMDDDAFMQEVKRYMHDPARILRLVGAEAKEIAPPTMLDPSGAAEVMLGYIAASQAIPKRVLIGSSHGELAAAKEDLRQWYAHIGYRQKNYAEPEILRPFIDKLIWMGALPEPAGGVTSYDIGQRSPEGDWMWPALHQLDDLELAQVREAKARAAKNLSDPMAAYPIDEGEMRDILGLRPHDSGTVQPEPEALSRAKQNYRDGKITAQQLAELVSGED